MEGVANAMQAILSDLGTFFTQTVTWSGDILDQVVESPALLILVIAMPVVGFAYGILRRLVRI